MKLKTDIHVNIDLHLSSDEPQTGDDLKRLATVLDGLQMLLQAQQQIDSAAPTIVQVSPPALPEPPPVVEATAVEKSASNGHAKTDAPASRAWSFEAFDQQVREEMKKLSRGGVMPGPTYWDSNRDYRLPTLAGVVKRYGLKNTAQLADRLGYLPPPRGRQAERDEDL